jgi:hypothetical protein
MWVPTFLRKVLLPSSWHFNENGIQVQMFGEIFFKNTEDRGRNLSRNDGIYITNYTA